MLCVVGTVAFYRGKKHPVKRKQYDQSPDGEQQVDKDVSRECRLAAVCSDFVN
ncbi:MAG: hypothetical protein ACLTML_01530 [Blautia faecis]